MPKGRPLNGHPDPVGCEQLFPGHEYTPDEVAFLRAVDAYRRRKGRRFLTSLDYREMFLGWGWRPPRGGKG